MWGVDAYLTSGRRLYLYSMKGTTDPLEKAVLVGEAI
jgi:hypothetical protein